MSRPVPMWIGPPRPPTLLPPARPPALLPPALPSALLPPLPYNQPQQSWQPAQCGGSSGSIAAHNQPRHNPYYQQQHYPQQQYSQHYYLLPQQYHQQQYHHQQQHHHPYHKPYPPPRHSLIMAVPQRLQQPIENAARGPRPPSRFASSFHAAGADMARLHRLLGWAACLRATPPLDNPTGWYERKMRDVLNNILHVFDLGARNENNTIDHADISTVEDGLRQAQEYVNSKGLGAPLQIALEPTRTARPVRVRYTFEDGSQHDYPSLTDESLGATMVQACRDMIGPEALGDFLRDTRFLLDGERVGPQTLIETLEIVVRLDEDTLTVNIDAMVPKNLHSNYPSVFERDARPAAEPEASGSNCSPSCNKRALSGTATASGTELRVVRQCVEER